MVLVLGEVLDLGVDLGLRAAWVLGEVLGEVLDLGVAWVLGVAAEVVFVLGFVVVELALEEDLAVRRASTVAEDEVGFLARRTVSPSIDFSLSIILCIPV